MQNNKKNSRSLEIRMDLSIAGFCTSSKGESGHFEAFHIEEDAAIIFIGFLVFLVVLEINWNFDGIYF